MGSVFVAGVDPPSHIHFANWKRLYSATFRPEYVPNRNFNELPWSVRDSAVCYYLEPLPIDRWQTRNFAVLLAAEDKYGFEVKKDNETVIERVFDAATIVKETEKITTHSEEGSATGRGGGGGTNNNLMMGLGMQQQQQQDGAGAIRRGQVLLPIGPIRVDLLTLRELIYKVDEYIYYGTAISEEELRGMEMAINRLKSRYGGILNPYR
jgi:hypothetical protein